MISASDYGLIRLIENMLAFSRIKVYKKILKANKAVIHSTLVYQIPN